MKTELSLLIGAVCISQFTTPAYEAKDFAVQVEARVSSSSSAIIVEWPILAGDSLSRYAISSKALGATAWTSRTGIEMVTAAGVFRFTDPLSYGTVREYEVVRNGINPPDPDHSGYSDAYGYVSIGLQAPITHSRGKIILLVDSTCLDDHVLAARLKRLEADMIGEGWQVLRHDVARGVKSYDDGQPGYNPTAYRDQVREMRSIIKADYDADTSNPKAVKAVLLFGHIAVPYSGDGGFAADGHTENHTGVWPADVYYGEMTAIDEPPPAAQIYWRDSQIFTGTHSGAKAWNNNAANDGKFDEQFIPVDPAGFRKVELAVGRVDFKQFVNWANKSEKDLLKAYLEKNHNYRIGAFNGVIRRKALINDLLLVPAGRNGTWPPAAMAWRSFPALFGGANVSTVDWDQYLSHVVNNSYLWTAVFSDAPHHKALNDLEPPEPPPSTVTYTLSTAFASSDIKVVFTSFLGSYIGDWDNENNFLRGSARNSHLLSGEHLGRGAAVVLTSNGDGRNDRRSTED